MDRSCEQCLRWGSDVFGVVLFFCSIHLSFAMNVLNDEAQLMLKLDYMADATKIFNEVRCLYSILFIPSFTMTLCRFADVQLISVDDKYWCAHVGKAVGRNLDSAHRVVGGLGVVVASRPDLFQSWAALSTLYYYLGIFKTLFNLFCRQC